MKSKSNDFYPLVSVVMPVYNSEAYLQESILSILNQTYKNIELVIVDDASTDNSIEIISNFLDKRIRLIKNKANLGVAASLNRGISNSRGDLICRMDADDISEVSRIFQQVNYLLLNKNVIIVGSWANFIDSEGLKICIYKPPISNYELKLMLPSTPFVHPSVMFRKSYFLAAGQYSENLIYGGEDAELFIRMAKLGEFYNINKPLINYRLVPGSMSSKDRKFNTLLSKQIQTNLLDSDIKERFNLSNRDKLHIYYFHIVKLCFWSAAPRLQTLMYLKSLWYCNQKKWLRKSGILFLILLLLLPKALLKNLYTFLKKRKYEFD